MDTKRCTRCNKLSRAEAETCSRCGYSFVASVSRAPTRSAYGSSNGKRNGRVSKPPLTTQRRSIPPASPHRAGHYSGLHPEDQPYQSTMMAVQHPPVRQSKPPVKLQHQSEGILITASTPEPDLYEQETLTASPSLSNFPPPPYVPNIPNIPNRPKRFWPRGRFVATALTVSCLLF